MRLLTVEMVQAQLQIMSTTKSDAQMLGAIRLATRHLESYLKTSFLAGSSIDYFEIDPADKTRQKRIQTFHLSKAFVNTATNPVKIAQGGAVPVSIGADYKLDAGGGNLALLRGPICGLVTVHYDYGFQFVVDASPKGGNDMIPADIENLPAGLREAALMLSMAYYGAAGDCGENEDCYLKNAGRSLLFLDRYNRRTLLGFTPVC